MIYIQINKDNCVVGYSSTKIFDNDIEVKAEDLEERFFNSPFFYVYKEISQKIEYSEVLYQDYLNKKSKPNSQSLFLKQMADIKIDSMNKNQQINNLTGQLAEVKLSDMKKDSIINNLVSQMAAVKVENMKMKGSNQ